MKTTMLIVCLGLALTVVASAADVTPNIDAGTKELRINGTLDTDTPLDYEYTIGVAVGRFVMDNLELGVAGSAKGNDLATYFEVGGFAEYSFDQGSAVVPFVFVGAAYVGTEIDDAVYNNAGETDFDTAVGKAGAGLAYFLTDSVAIEVRGVYSVAADDLYVDQDGKREDSNLTTSLGVRFYWD